MRFFVDDVLGRAFIEIRVRLELEEQVEDVYDQEHDASTAADLEGLDVGVHLIGKGCVKGCLFVVSIKVEALSKKSTSTYRQKQTHDCKTKQTGTHVGHGVVVDLLLEAQTTKQKGHA